MVGIFLSSVNIQDISSLVAEYLGVGLNPTELLQQFGSPFYPI